MSHVVSRTHSIGGQRFGGLKVPLEQTTSIAKLESSSNSSGPSSPSKNLRVRQQPVEYGFPELFTDSDDLEGPPIPSPVDDNGDDKLWVP